jgi:nucleotide-binding universal stress UspA family protein
MNTPNPSKPANGIGLRFDDVNFKRVLVPVDFSVCTLETLRYAKSLVEKSDTVVDVLHVVHPVFGRNEVAMPGPGLIRTMVEGARQELKRLVGVLWANESNVPVSIRVREGRADEVILREAGSTNASLIIMGMRSRSWLSGWLRRHTAKHVIQNSPCPVMVFRVGMTGSETKRIRAAILQ